MPASDVPAVVGGRYALLPEPGRPTPHGERRAATRLADGVPVEVELLSPALADDPGTLARLTAGGDALRTLAGRHVVRTLHVLLPGEPGVVALVRDRFPATVLADARRQEGGTVPPQQAVTRAVEVLSGLVEVHSAGLVHGALSERDVLLDTSVPLRTVVRVTGYGTAALLGRPVDVPRAPGAGPVPSAADDVWAAGALLVQLLTGAEHPDDAALRSSGLPAPLVAAVLPLLDADPDARPSAEQAREALAAVRGLAGLPPLAPRTAPAALRAPVAVLPAGGAAVLAAGGPSVPTAAEAAGAAPVAPIAPDAPVDPADPPAAAPVPVDATPPPVSTAPPLVLAPEPLDPDPPRPPLSPGRRRAAVLTTVAVLAVLAFVGALLTSGGAREDTSPVLAPPPAAEGEPAFDFAEVIGPGGLTVQRRWELSEDGAVLTGSTVVRNATAADVQADVDEVVPKSVAADADDLDFTPAPDEVVEQDPVVRYRVRVAPGDSRTWAFRARLASPVTTPQGLAALAAEADTARAAHEAELARARDLRLLRLTVAPTTLRLAPGQTAQLTVSGRLSDGRVLRGAAVPGLTVRSANLGVVQTRGDRVRGRAPGRAFVVAQAGEVRAQVLVVVVAPSPPPAPAAAPVPAPTRAAPRPTPPAPRPTAAAPRTARPAPRPTTAAPRPGSTFAPPPPPRPRPTTAAPRPSSAAPRPSSAAPRPSTAAPRPTRSPTRAPAPAPSPTRASPRPTFA